MSDEERRITISHRVQHALFSGAVSLAGLAGERGSAAFGEAVGRLGYYPLKFRRNVVEKNLRTAFPERGDAWIQETMRATYAHLGREALESIRLAHTTREELIARTYAVGFDEYVATFQEGKGVVIVTGHVGNHEIGAAALAARGFPLDVVIQRQQNPLFDDALNKARQRMGTGIIDRFKAPRLAIKALREGRNVGFAADQNAGKSGAFVPFFGKVASTHRGPALFAVKTGAPLIICTTLRKGNMYEGTFQRVDVDRSGPLDEVVHNLTAAFTAKLEEVVRGAPEQYLWLHRRGKTRPDGERKEDKQV